MIRSSLVALALLLAAPSFAEPAFVLAMGDSICAGGPILGSGPNLVELLQTRRRGEHFAVHNVCVGGYTVQNVRDLYDTSYRLTVAARVRRPHNKLLLCPAPGTNDLAAGTASATIITRLDGLVTRALDDGFEEVILCTILPRKNGASYSAGLQTRQNEVNAWILARTGTTRIDTYAAMGETSPADATALESSYDTDGLHPNAAGHVKLADTVDAAVSW
jgi:lysophospholipase L1-like esterase